VSGKSSLAELAPVAQGSTLIVTTTFPAAFAAIPRVLATLDLGPGGGPAGGNCPLPAWYIFDVTAAGFKFAIANPNIGVNPIVVDGGFIHWEACAEFETPAVADTVAACDFP
jgi:hypothetical protein